MSALSDGLFFGGILGAGLLSGGHCLGMCGAIAAHAGGERRSAYQSGRLVGYLAIGAAAGAFGDGLYFLTERHPGLKLALLAFALALTVAQSVAIWRGRPDAAPAARFLRRIGFGAFGTKLRFRSEGFGWGLGTALLPCGVLVSFVLVAAAAGTSLRGMGVFALLWAGTLPALVLAERGGVWMRATPARSMRRRFSALAILALGGIAVLGRVELPSGARGPTIDFFCGPHARSEK